MAENEKTIHQLDSLNINSSTEFEIDNVDPLDPAKRVSGKTTANALGLDIATTQQYTTALDGFTSKTVTGALQELRASAGGSANANIADDFDPTVTYETGDFCIKDGLLYKYTADQPSAGAWDASKWTQTTVTDELGSGSIPDISNVVFPIVGGE